MNLLVSKGRRRTSISFLPLLVTSVLLLAQSFPSSRGQESRSGASGVDKAELHQALLDLTNAATVMCVAAHPDDEDGTTLTVLRRKYGVHTVTLFSTYGEGGQNAVGPELYEALGVIRERETRAASRIQGSEPYFLELRDFGFSKSAEEAFQVWGHDEGLRRMVAMIRKLRPHVIITNHDTTTGHGHHQATGRLVLEAFAAAGDANRFPEQLAGGGRVWQPSRLFVRARGQSGNTAATSANEKFVTIDPNEIDPIRGTMYAEQALAALQKHASQGPWPASIAERLRGNPSGKLPLIRYRLAREAAGSVDLPREANSFLAGLAIAPTHPAPTVDGRSLAEIIDQPDRVLNALINWVRRTTVTSVDSIDSAKGPLMTERANRALAVAAGVTVSVSTRSDVLVPGTPTTFTVNITNAGNRTVKIKKLTFSGWAEEVELKAAEQLNGDTETSNEVDRVTPPNATFTVPQSEHLYDGLLSGQTYVAKTDLEVDGAKFWVDAERSVSVAPSVQIKHISPVPYVWTTNTSTRPVRLRLTLVNNLFRPFRGIVKLRGPQSRPFAVGRAVTLKPHETSELTLQANALPSVGRQRRRGPESPQLTLSVLSSISTSTVTALKVPIVLSDARVSANNVGYLPSFDTTLEQALEALGVSARKLSVQKIQQDALAGYDTIIIDNRGYYAHPELIAVNAKLMKYVEEGGTLVVFYHKDSEWNPNPERRRPQLAPYPIILGDERVTEEVAAIRFLEPRHPLLNYPNKIGGTDFNGWIQERGLYYPSEWDSHYTALFESNDKGEKPLRGGLLVARYGRGNYIYTSMVWYRQLGAGVPGAYRMLANMISYGSNSR